MAQGSETLERNMDIRKWGCSLRRWRAQEETGLKEQTGPAQSFLLAALATGPSSALISYENLHLNDEHTYPA